MELPRRSSPAASEAGPALDLHALAQALRRGWPLVAVSFAASVAAAAAFTFLQTPFYESSSVVYVDTEARGGGNSLADVLSLGQEARSLQNEVETLRLSHEITERVAARLVGRPYTPRADAAVRIRAADLAEAVTFEPVSEKVDMIRITATSPDAAEAARIANLYAAVYREHGRQSSRAVAVSSRSFLESQAEQRRGELASAEAELEAFMEREGAVDIGKEGEHAVAQVAALDAAVEETRVELEVGRAQLRALDTELARVEPGLPARVASGAEREIAALHERVAELEVRASDYYAVNPGLRGNEASEPELAALVGRIGEMRRQVDGLSRRYVEEVLAVGGVDPSVDGTGLGGAARLRRDAAEASVRNGGLEVRLATLLDRQRAYEGRLRAIPRQAVRMAQLERARKAGEETYLFLAQRAEEARVAEESELGYINVIREARPPARPVSPRPTQNLALGGLLGLLLGVGLALLRQAADTAVRTADDVRQHGLAVLGTVPRFEPVLKREFGGHPPALASGLRAAPHIVAALHPLSAVTEAFRHVRTAVGFSQPDRGVRTLMVTSARPGDGKSTSAVGLALAFAQAGKRTLLIDADLRLPTLHTVLGLERGGGLSELLFAEGPIDWSPYHLPLQADWGGFKTAVEGLHVVTAGRPVPNPTELLGSQKLRGLLAEAAHAFDAVVIDTSPVLVVPDGRLVAADCDAAVLVATAGRTSWRALTDAREAVEASGADGARVIGVVLNRVEETRAAKNGYGGYGYSYGYGAPGSKQGSGGAGLLSPPATTGDGASGEPALAGHIEHER